MTVDELIEKLQGVMHQWHRGTRQGNDGNQGNTLEDLLGVPENNIPLPDLGGVYELKTQKKESSALVTLLHSDPTIPQTPVPKLCVSLGWPHKDAGGKYPVDEMSFRSTTYGHAFSDRGFRIQASEDILEFMFSPNEVQTHKEDKSKAFGTYGDWLADLSNRDIHYTDVLPVQYDMRALAAKIKAKLDNTVFVLCKTKKCPKTQEKLFFYDQAFILSGFKVDNLVDLLNSGGLYLDFDARTRHNHGTKIRVKTTRLKDLFEHSIVL
ncbi:MvaI/BcnI family restriction endonuclease [Photobacterium damselae subsp. damselae]|uniref:MvaI/BcnI family restriction endonuclease n=1 Tax=Photobacterium damselae TaxID=38293 RepID=UPI00311B30A8